MKKSFLILFVILLMIPARAEVNPDLPIEYLPWRGATGVEPLIQVTVQHLSDGTFEYTYDVTSGPASVQPFVFFNVGTSAADDFQKGDGQIPSGWAILSFGEHLYPDQVDLIVAVAQSEEDMLLPGESMEGFVIRTAWLPGIGLTYSQGDIPPPTGQQIQLPPPPGYSWRTEHDSVKVQCVVPLAPPFETYDPVAHLDYIAVQLDEAITAGWVPSPGPLQAQLAEVRQGVASGDAGPALQAFYTLLDQAQTEGLHPFAYELLRPNLAYLQSVVAPTAQPPVLYNSQDTVLRAREPHANEGANPGLTLAKDGGQPVRPLIGFELGLLNPKSVARATLVLTLDPLDSATGWGNGREVLARPVLQDWVEGNGRSLGVPKQSATSGAGRGATWFSPSDAEIANDHADGHESWDGGDLGSGPVTGPAVVITNHLRGEVHFDVTADVRNGNTRGWLVVRQDERVGSAARFFSREGAAAAGNPDLAPRLVLEYGSAAGLSRILAGTAAGMCRPSLMLAHLALAARFAHDCRRLLNFLAVRPASEASS